MAFKMKSSAQKFKSVVYLFIPCAIGDFVLSLIFSRIFDVFMYASIATAILSIILNFLILKLIPNRFWRDSTVDVLINLLSTVLLFNFLTLVPLNVDRSFSVWMIGSLDSQAIRSGEGIKIVDLKKRTSQYFSPNSGEVQRRIDEQVNLGNFKIVRGKIYLTNRGRIQAKLDKILTRIFALNKKYSYGG